MMHPTPDSQYSSRALKAIEGKDPQDQLGLLYEYVIQFEADHIPVDEINVVRRTYIRIASEIYRGVSSQ